jgi:crossover junction endodeoxyribonuclease RuvC
MNYIGIDPGKQGAVAVLSEDGFPMLYDCPLVGKELDVVSMATLLRPYCELGAVAILEKVGARPGQGVVSMFSFGVGYGMWRGILAAFGARVHLVAPQTWKAAMLRDTDKSKDASVLTAMSLFPGLAAKQLTGSRGGIKDGRAEALLLAEYGRRTNR